MRPWVSTGVAVRTVDFQIIGARTGVEAFEAENTAR
jgi:hypothetical protein